MTQKTGTVTAISTTLNVIFPTFSPGETTRELAPPQVREEAKKEDDKGSRSFKVKGDPPEKFVQVKNENSLSDGTGFRETLLKSYWTNVRTISYKDK